MAWSGSLVPHFVNNDYVTAEIIYSPARVHLEVYVTAEITYSTLAGASQGTRLFTGYFVLCTYVSST